MFSHLTIGTHDLARAVAFYDVVLTPLGIERLSDIRLGHRGSVRARRRSFG
jgi:catechol 2,3-dioxygenase-like lactoylglutathione lyase family enzyme